MPIDTLTVTITATQDRIIIETEHKEGSISTWTLKRYNIAPDSLDTEAGMHSASSLLPFLHLVEECVRNG